MWHSREGSKAAVKWWPQNRGLLSTALNGDVVGTKVSGHYREGDQFSLKGTPLQIFSKRRNRLA